MDDALPPGYLDPFDVAAVADLVTRLQAAAGADGVETACRIQVRGASARRPLHRRRSQGPGAPLRSGGRVPRLPEPVAVCMNARLP